MMTKVQYELKPSKPKEWGYFAINVSGRINGTVSPVERIDGTVSPVDFPLELTGIGGSKTAFEGKVPIRDEVSEDWKLSFKSKLEQKNLNEIVAAFSEGGSGNPVMRLAAAFGKTLGLEASNKVPRQIGPVDVNIGGGVEVSQTPFYFSTKFSSSNTTSVSGRAYKYQVVVEGRVYVGLSARGAEELIKLVGPKVVRQVLTKAGTSMLKFLNWIIISETATAVVAITGSIIATIGLVALDKAIVEHAIMKGVYKGIETWYVSAYSAKIFHNSRPHGYHASFGISNVQQLTQWMIESGEKDAVIDARQTARRLGDRDADSISDELILSRHRARLESLYGGKTSSTEFYLKQELQNRAKGKLGLR